LGYSRSPAIIKFIQYEVNSFISNVD
jgi:hypothetical protein